MTYPFADGIYDGIPDTVYHADRHSLSSSGARALLAPSCPELFRHKQDSPPETNKNFDLGHAAHTMILGEGPEMVAYPETVLASNGAASTKAAKEFAAEARAAGQVPMKQEDVDAVNGMADAIKAHPVAASLFADGAPEQSIYWTDPATGVQLRCRPDWMPNPRGGRMIITDYKTAVSSEKSAFSAATAKFGYHQQDPWYRAGIRAMGIDDDPAFIFVVQEKEAPYLVQVFELDRDAVALGERLNRRAIEVYRDCMESGIWPGRSQEVELVDIPRWAYYQQEDSLYAS